MADEKRLIYANDLWTDIMMLPHNGDIISSEDVEQAILEAPTVEAVEVVRCKECKHFKRICEGSGRFMCMIPNGLIAAKEDDFCSYGERKDENEDEG